MKILNKVWCRMVRKLQSDEFMRAAYHEAGHAFMALKEGWKVNLIQIDFKKSIQRTVYDIGVDISSIEVIMGQQDRPAENGLIEIARKRAMVTMAGGASENEYATRYHIKTFVTTTSDLDREQFQIVESFLKTNFNITLKGLFPKVQKIIKDNWRFIENIVDELLINRMGCINNKAIEKAYKKA
jgi:hypothetical protein